MCIHRQNQTSEIIHEYINTELPMGIGDVPYACDLLPSSCIDLTRIYEDTGFVPRVDFKEGIKAVINSMEKEMGNEQ